MKPIRLNTIAATAVVAAILTATPLMADDLIINGTISGTQVYDSLEGIVFDAAA